MSESARTARRVAMWQWADGFYSTKGIFDEVVVYYDAEAVYFPTGDKNSGTVGFSYVTLGKVTGN